MILISEFIRSFPGYFPVQVNMAPWQITTSLPALIQECIATLNAGYIIEGEVAVHNTAVVEAGAVIKGPAVIGAGCFVGAHAYIRGGVFLGAGVRIGTGCEIKTSIIHDNSAIAHFNFIGDSIIGSEVNFEAGSITANHYNERHDKNIFVDYHGVLVSTGVNKFGALVGDGSKIGANAVLSPGTILAPATIVKRLELVNQQEAKQKS